MFYFKPNTWQKITRHGNLLLAGALLLVAGAWFLAHDDDQYEMQGAIFGYPAISIAYAALVLAALSPTSLLYRYPSRIMRFIATLSYAIYLTHKQLIHLTLPVLKSVHIREDSYLAFIICMAVSVLGGWLLHILVERPFLRLRDRFLRNRRNKEKKVPVPL